MTYSEHRAADLLFHAVHAEDPQQILFLDFTAVDIARICVNVVPQCPRCEAPEWQGTDCPICKLATELLVSDEEVILEQ